MPDRTNTFYESLGFVGYGSQLEVGQNTSPETFKAIAFIDTITPGKMSTNTADMTHLRSPQAHREHKATIRDSAAFTMTGSWVPTEDSQANETGLVFLWRTRAERNFQIVLSDASPGTIWPFRGVVTAFTPGNIMVDGKVPFTAEITPLHDFSAGLP